MTWQIIKWVGIALATLFGIGCVLAFALFVFIVASVIKRRKGDMYSELPWTCILLDGRCIEPDKPCTECRIWEKYRKERKGSD